jgi:hypothetical protein
MRAPSHYLEFVGIDLDNRIDIGSLVIISLLAFSNKLAGIAVSDPAVDTMESPGPGGR